MAGNPGRGLTYASKFSTQTFKSSPTSCLSFIFTFWFSFVLHRLLVSRKQFFVVCDGFTTFTLVFGVYQKSNSSTSMKDVVLFI